ncbi:hypothetical protein EVAR_62857_1 [Eumeta japonica]|uniref:Uncharacterized protein n=1 Tax=Eumeta variegata TaxID=151549 RepID=A0A4C1ZZB6_EUMVA|nr:hypothetical protein EVAR_62857_1 [Eumeta japonica]
MKSLKDGMPWQWSDIEPASCSVALKKEKEKKKKNESNEPKLDGVASFNYGVPTPSSSIIRPWLPYSIKVLVKRNQTSPNSMGLRRLITEFLWPPSSSIIRR